MTTTGPNSAGAGASIAGALQNWTNPGNITSSNDSDARVANVTTGADTDLLAATQLGFSIAADQSILGITVEIEAADLGTLADTALSIVQLTKDGSTGVGSDLESGTQQLTLTDTYYTYGGAANLWGTTWTYAEVNASTFGVLIAARGIESGNAGFVDIDHVRITITHETAASGIATKMFQYRLRRAA